jgi:hypothetical protein
VRTPRPPRRPVRALGTALLTLLAAVAVATPALAATPTPPPLPSGPGSTMRSAPVEPRAGQAAKARLDARRADAPANVTAWWVDPRTHQTVVAVVGPATRSAGDFAADENPAAVRIQPMSAPIRPLAAGPLAAGPLAAGPLAAGPLAAGPLIGGTAITTSGTRCSDGFSARRGTTTYLLTAGHCTAEGKTWNGPDRQPIGTVVRTQYPGSDYGIVQVTNTAAWRGSGQVKGGPTVTGATEATTGASVCRSVST